MRPTCVIAANATPRQGGQGWVLHHAILALREAFDLSVFARGGDAGALPMQAVPRSRLARAVRAVPVARRLRDWIIWADEAHFDGWVSRRLPAVRLFHGATGQCLRSALRARRQGSQVVVDVPTFHAETFAAEVARACAPFGIRSPLHPGLVERCLAEYDAADLIRVMSDRARATFVERGMDPARVFVASPPVELADFPAATFAQDRFRVCFVGLIEPWKGFQFLVEAFGRLAVRDAELVLWGGPGSRPVSRYLESRIRADSRIRVQPVDVRRYGYGKVYGSSNVLVHPSLSDGYGYVVAEAMASGLPVIVTDRTGAADLVEDGRNGYVVPARDPDAIRDRLQHLADHPGLAREMGAAARATMAAQTLERFRAQYVPRLEALVS